MVGSTQKDMMATIRHRAASSLEWLALLLAFFLPLSTSAVSVLALFIFIAWIGAGDYARKLNIMLGNPVCLAVFVYLGLFLLGLLWTEHLGAGLEDVQKQWKLLLFPVLLSSISFNRRRGYLISFLTGLAVAMLMTYLAWFDLLHFGGVTPEHPTRGLFHVIYNPLLAFGFYLVCHEIIWGGVRGLHRVGLVVFALLTAFDMFITEGRTGQLVFFVLSGLLFVQFFRTKRIQGVVLALIVLSVTFFAGYQLSPTFQNRVSRAIQEVRQFQDDPDTSVGLRLLFWKNSWQIIAAHPFVGVGTGDFQSSYAAVNAASSPAMVATDNPHNQYVFSLCRFGLPGLVSLLAIFITQLYQAVTVKDDWQRIRLAFPIFFLTIMLTESYLRIYETGFFFALFSAVFYRDRPDRRLQGLRSGRKRCWLILSYRANVRGSACSQHIDDRLPFFREQGIEPVLLTGPVGEKSTDWVHFRTHSLAPSGIRFELRHALRKRLQKRWQFKLVETILLLPVYPLYLLEKICINLESEWSWCLLASVRGFLLCRELRPEAIYSTGGSASAHVAALVIKRLTGISWLAETQDPLVHDHDWQRSRLVLQVYKRLEKMSCRQADVFVFLVRAAMEHTAQRVQGLCRGAVVYPGAVPASFRDGFYTQGDCCHFAHFGSLAGTRNLVVFFQALQQVLAQDNSLRSSIQVDVYGSFDAASEREMKSLQLEDLVVCHGTVDRQQALVAMQKTDCLLLIQNIIYFSCETIPSKVYEYLLSGRPIIGLLHHNEELRSMLLVNEHLVVPADDVSAVSGAIQQILDAFQTTKFVSRYPKKIWTVADAVQRLVSLVGR